ncbi:RDD family protein [Stakelama saccharophila]|uniref:RDD family protein n=1 Tax=Stakelama saccharophila TaxID=3075605 RepID=A0ABZ0BEH1_9SPHN|nr:RDD family protein [Stakelama sp. W311]WNO54774.1 RDD family protein [Stakelama sp. W311]
MTGREDRARSLDRELTTPEGVTLRLELAGAGARAGAFLLDCLVLVVAMVAMTIAAVLAFRAIGKTYPGVIAVLWLLVFFLLRNFYFTLMESGRRAATIGKRILKMRVVARDGGRLTGGAVVARNLLRELEIFLPLTFLGVGAIEGFVDRWVAIFGFCWALLFLFFPLFNRDRLRAGDLVAGTWVVFNQRRAMGVDLLRRAEEHGAVPRFSPQDLAAYGQFELQRLEDVLRRDDADAITLVAGAIRRKLGRTDSLDDRMFLDAYYAALRGELERELLFGRRKRDKFDDATRSTGRR